jgi:hypothetical protein
MLVHICHCGFELRVFENIDAAAKCNGKLQKHPGSSVHYGGPIVPSIGFYTRREGFSASTQPPSRETIDEGSQALTPFAGRAGFFTFCLNDRLQLERAGSDIQPYFPASCCKSIDLPFASLIIQKENPPKAYASHLDRRC